jgi:ribosomal protein S18 acetylase RimI-like enzyme
VLDQQGTGVGRALMAHAERYAREIGRPELRLYTNAAMTENLALYSRLGYREVGRRSEHCFERVYFAKTPPTDTHTCWSERRDRS